MLFAGPTPTSAAYEANEVLWAHPQEEARQPGASLWAGAVAIPLTWGLSERLQSAAPMRLPRSPEDMELDAVLRGTKVVELINVPHRARGLLQEFPVNGPGRPAPEQEWPPPQQGALSRVVRVRFESPALARMGLRRLEEAMLGVVGHHDWHLQPTLVWRPEHMEDWAPEWRVEFKSFPASKVASLPMLLLAGSPLQGPARGDGRSEAGGAEMRHQGQSSDGDTNEYGGSSSEEGEAPVSVGTKRDYTRQRTAAPGLVNGEGGGDMLADDSPGTAATSQGRKRGTTGGGQGSGGTKRDCTRKRTATPGLRDSGGGCDMAADDAPGTAATNQGRKRGTTDGGPGRRRGAGGGGGAGAADVTGAMEQGFSPRRAGGSGAAGGAGGGGPGGQQEIGGGGGFWQNDNGGMDIGGRSTSTPAAETGTVGGDGGAEEIGSSSGGDSGGAAEEMDQDGSGLGGLSGRLYPAGWKTKTAAQKHKYNQRRRK